MSDVTGVVLAGGRNRRFGSNKALTNWQTGATLVETTVNNLKSVFPKVLVLVKEVESYSFLNGEGVRVEKDLYSDFHSLGGIYSGLSMAETRYIFACGCDMPFVKAKLIRGIIEERSRYDAVIPQYEEKLQPLCGVYSKECLKVIKLMIENQQFKIVKLFENINSQIFPEDKIKKIDLKGESFFDIDTIDDFLRAKKIITG